MEGLVRLKLDLFVAAQKTKREIILVFGAEMCTGYGGYRGPFISQRKKSYFGTQISTNRPPKQWAIHLGHLYSPEAILIAALGNLGALPGVSRFSLSYYYPNS